MKRVAVVLFAILLLVFLIAGNAYGKNDEIIISANRLDRSSIVESTVLNGNGTVSNNEYYATTDYIAVSPREIIRVQFGAGGELSNNIEMRRVVAFDDEKNARTYSEEVVEYQVPEGCSYIRFSARKDWLMSDFARVSINQEQSQYERYYEEPMQELVRSSRTDLSSIFNYPLSSLPDYVLNSLAYRPLGMLEKGYICFVSDDGQSEVETYTIPLFIRKGVPCTLAMMSTSAVLSTETGCEAVLDAVNKYGFCVAQHGGSYWDVEDEYTLNEFFDKEQLYWDSLGISPYGAVVPGHKTNNIIRAVCGGRFGCLRTGYSAGTPYYGDVFFINGPRSNIYSLTSMNVVDITFEQHKEALDITAQNHYLRIIHFHESDLTEDNRDKLEKVIDYAKEKGLTFITLQDIPEIT